MKLVPISSIFDIEYGNQFDLNKLSQCEDIERGVAFISRTSKNNGVHSWVEPSMHTNPYSDGLITVTLGGTYLLSAFVQQHRFYTAQNIKVLTPKYKMSLKDKLIYCAMIKHNRFKYTSHGREANKTFDDILIPCLAQIKDISVKMKYPQKPSNSSLSDVNISLNINNWKYFLLSDYFDMSAGSYYATSDYSNGTTPLITASDSDNGVRLYFDIPANYAGNSITVGKIGASAFYQSKNYCASSDVTTLTPINDFNFNSYIGIFLATLINKEKIKWSYGRQLRLNDCIKMKLKLPMKNNQPDWQFMEDYIKSLPYSSNL